ncbi:helix-turn-helix domain-containing protein [Alteromonas sp. H39]|uniref:helix-turn-helix domain-containing protein n=1 Tax=Alteromonas sp. H39 TaxID=3389876 RepID=UPI0039DF75CE
MDQEELATRAGLSRRAISNIENGKNCNTASLLKVLEQLDLLDDFQLMVDDKLARINTNIQRKSNKHTGELSNDF